ncbi:O-antigen ligase family protein [Cytobacillus oceanisediminis]|uniref:O-antigen ligase family protein n=1 Tax=Cytobacillus oceanisediminis TaxID=665099 RepID=UPI003736EC56
MISIKGSNNKSSIILYTILVFIAVYLNLSSLGVSLRISNEVYLGTSLAFYVAYYFIYSINNGFHLNFKALLLLLCSYVSIFLTMLFNQDFDILNFVIILQILIAFLFINTISFDDFVRAYIRVILFISIFSLVIMFVIVPFFSGISSLFPLRYNSTGLAVRDYIFSFHFESHSVASRRNTGIFREMGVYQFYLNMALLMYLFYLRENKVIVILIFSATVISTFSTPGILFMFLILIVYLYENYKKELVKVFKLIFSLSFLFLIVFLFYPNIFSDFIYSINKLSEQGNSFNGRLGSIIGNILAWVHNPLIGNGINNGIKLAEEMYLGQFTTHNTSTTTSFMAMFGIFFSILMSLPIILLLNKLKIKTISKLVLVFGLFLSINSERLIYDQFYYIFVFCYFMKISIIDKVNGKVW